MIINCFENNAKFNKVRDQSFTIFMNLWVETPLAMAAYCD